MLPSEVGHLCDQLIAGDLTPADLFCITLSLYEPEDASCHLTAVIQQLESDQQLFEAAAELRARFVDLFGSMPGKSFLCTVSRLRSLAQIVLFWYGPRYRSSLSSLNS